MLTWSGRTAWYTRNTFLIFSFGDFSIQKLFKGTYVFRIVWKWKEVQIITSSVDGTVLCYHLRYDYDLNFQSNFYYSTSKSIYNQTYISQMKSAGSSQLNIIIIISLTNFLLINRYLFTFAVIWALICRML